MSYEETVIDGVLHYRYKPERMWVPYKAIELTGIIMKLKGEIKDHCHKMELLIKALG